MIQTQGDRAYWHMPQQHHSSYPYNTHMRNNNYSSHWNTPVHHHAAVSPIHHSSLSSPMHHPTLMHSSYVPLTHSMLSSHSILHQHSHSQSDSRQELSMARDLYSDHPAHATDGFPTRSQFEVLLNDYILSLSPKKRDKALIPQKRYDNILAVLKDPKCTTIESAQFRFWAKKMFRLSQDEPGNYIVCHEGKPVAVRERLYTVLTESHNRAQHGGRDKTSAEVRKLYSWVPKELIARFVRNCPSCTLRRSSPLDYPNLPSRSPSQESSISYHKSMDSMSPSPTYHKSMDSMSPSPTYGKSLSHMGAPSPTYSSSSGGHSPISLRHPSHDSMAGSPIHELGGSQQTMQAMSNEVSYQYSGYGSNMGEPTGNGLVAVSSMDSHGLYSRAN